MISRKRFVVIVTRSFREPHPFVFVFFNQRLYVLSKEQAFYKTLVESGINLEEPEFVEYFDPTPGLDYDAKNFHHEKRIVPFPPIQNKLKREALKKLQIGEKA